MSLKKISKTSQRTCQARVRVTIQFLKADICNLQLQQNVYVSLVRKIILHFLSNRAFWQKSLFSLKTCHNATENLIDWIKQNNAFVSS